jgi:tRNA(Ser,Leu) C12 N-acetylase TAN1
MNPKDITLSLDSLCRIDPSRFWHTYHWIPIEQWCLATIKEMSQTVKNMVKRIDSHERWRMQITKRFYNKHHTPELLKFLTQHVDRPHVDLENPEKTIRIEIIGSVAAFSLLKPREHFSVNKVKDEVLTSLITSNKQD